MTDQNNDLLSGGNAKDTSQGKPTPAEIRAMLVGEGKPFKTEDDLAAGKFEADKFIEKLKEENAEMRNKLSGAETSQKTNELLQTIMAKLGTSDGGDGGNQPTALTREEIVTMVRDTVSEAGKTQERKANRFAANAEVLKIFGNDTAKAKAHVQARAEALGLSFDALGGIAETQPKVFLELMGVGGTRAPRVDNLPPGGRKPGEKIPGSEGVVRNYAYYKALRKEIGSKYYEPRVQQQLFKDRKELGEDFFDKPQTA